MKKKIAIIALIAIFVSVGSLSAQTKTISKTTTKTEVKSTKKCATATPACCAAKDSKCCKGKTVAEKAKCIAKCNKATASTGTKACTESKKVVTKKI